MINIVDIDLKKNLKEKILIPHEKNISEAPIKYTSQDASESFFRNLCWVRVFLR